MLDTQVTLASFQQYVALSGIKVRQGHTLNVAFGNVKSTSADSVITVKPTLNTCT